MRLVEIGEGKCVEDCIGSHHHWRWNDLGERTRTGEWGCGNVWSRSHNTDMAITFTGGEDVAKMKRYGTCNPKSGEHNGVGCTELCPSKAESQTYDAGLPTGDIIATTVSTASTMRKG